MKKNELKFNSFQIESFSPGKKNFFNNRDKTVYHYTSPEAFLSIIQNQTLRFTDIRYLNDRTEGIYFIKTLLDFMEKNKERFPCFNEVVNELLKKNDFNKIRNLEITDIEYNDIPGMPYKPERVFVFCTCLEADSLNMWNYYVNNGSYQGYNIGFRIPELLKAFDTPAENQMDAFTVHYGKVLYSEKEHYTEIEKLADGMEKEITKSILSNGNTKERSFKFAQLRLRDYINSLGAFYKHPKFKSEEEFRVIIEITDERVPRKEHDGSRFFGKYNQKMRQGFCAKQGLVVPFLTVTFPANAIFRITVAPMVEFDIAKNSVRELLNVSKINEVKIHKSTIPIRF